jgi:hypothetical protein
MIASRLRRDNLSRETGSRPDLSGEPYMVDFVELASSVVNYFFMFVIVVNQCGFHDLKFITLLKLLTYYKMKL